MSEFEPAIAYRILKEKLERLKNEAHATIRDRVRLDYGKKPDRTESDRLSRLTTSLYDEQDRLYPVLRYLEARMKEENDKL